MRALAALLAGLTLACTTTYQGPAIHAFTATPNPVESGKTVEFNWAVTGYTHLFIDQGVGEVTKMHHIIITPTITKTYTLLAVGRGGEVTASVQVKVWAYGGAQ